MKWVEVTIAKELRRLCEQLRQAIEPKESEEKEQHRIFRNKTVLHIHRALAEVGQVVAGGPLESVVIRLGEVLRGIGAADLRQGKILRAEIAACLKQATREISEALAQKK